MRQAIRNRSLPIIEPVSRLPVRILKFVEQRPGSEKRLFGSKIGHDPGQRLGRLRVTDGHVEGSSTRGGHGAETGLAGCPRRIRTSLCLFRAGLLASD